MDTAASKFVRAGIGACLTLVAAFAAAPVSAQFVGPASDADAARFLAQATFGTTLTDIQSLRALGYQAWLNKQFAAAPSVEAPYLDWVKKLPDDSNSVDDSTRMQAWAINSLGTGDPSRAGFPGNAPTDQLRQRVAFALSELFVVSNKNGTLAYEPWALASYYDTLSADAFGNYRTLLEDVTKHPTMGTYLSMIQNQKADPTQNIHPDENYAREVLQLFSIGLVQLNLDGTPQLDATSKPIPTYSQVTVRGFAAVFTGWNWNNTGCGPNTWTCCDQDNYFDWACAPSDHDVPAWRKPMQPVEFYHDNTSDKQLLVYPSVALANGVLVHGGAAQAEMTAALDNIFHHPNVGPFVSKQLIQRLVTSNPTPAYVQRVANVFNNNGAGVRGDLKAVVQAILLDDEARNGQNTAPTTFGKLREPLLKLTHVWRAMASKSVSGRNDNVNTWPPIEDLYGEAPLRSPSVFNFFKPVFVPPGEPQTLALRAPEFQILTDTAAVLTPNHLYHEIFCNYIGSQDCWGSDDAATIQMNLARDATLAESNPAQLIDQYNLLFLSGQMSSFMRGILLTRLNAITQGNNGASLGVFRVQHALYLILDSPEYAIQK